MFVAREKAEYRVAESRGRDGSFMFQPAMFGMHILHLFFEQTWCGMGHRLGICGVMRFGRVGQLAWACASLPSMRDEVL